jgi:hypothetical protein
VTPKRTSKPIKVAAAVEASPEFGQRKKSDVAAQIDLFDNERL